MRGDGAEVRLRRMNEAHLEQVTAIAASLKDAPHWPPTAYLAALKPGSTPRRIALVAEETCEGAKEANEVAALKGHGFSRAGNEWGKDSALAAEGIQIAEVTFPQGLKPGDLDERRTARLKPCPFKAPHSEARPASSPAGSESGSNKVLGFLIASLLPPQAELETIAVSAAAQRHGIGRRLFFAMDQELRAAGVGEVLLEVRASNRPALCFYRSLGWSETGHRPRYYADPEEDAVLMSLKLK